jgi:SAM-dependent methyltransferase
VRFKAACPYILCQVKAHQNSDNWSIKAKQYIAMASKGSIVYHFSELACDILFSGSCVLPSEGTLLDVCAGPAVFSIAVMNKVGLDELASTHFVITDFSEGMVEAARETVGVVAPARPNTQFLVMDVQAISLPTASVDVVGCMFGYFVPDRQKAFSEVCRVCRPSGRAVIGTWKHTGLVYVLGDFLEFLGGSWDYSSMPLAYACADREALRDELLAAGFSLVEIHERSHVFELPVDGDALTSVFGNPRIQAHLAGRPPGTVQEEWARFVRSADCKHSADIERGVVFVTYTANIALCIK